MDPIERLLTVMADIETKTKSSGLVTLPTRWAFAAARESEAVTQDGKISFSPREIGIWFASRAASQHLETLTIGVKHGTLRKRIKPRQGWALSGVFEYTPNRSDSISSCSLYLLTDGRFFKEDTIASAIGKATAGTSYDTGVPPIAFTLMGRLLRIKV